MDIFKLVGSVWVDTTEAIKSLAKTDEKAEGLGTTFANAGKAVGKAALAVGAAAVGAGTALVGMANNAAQTADTIDKGSIRMGVSTDYYQQLAYAAGQSGVEMTTLEKAAKKLEGTDIGLEDALSQIMALGTEEERSAAAAELFGDTVAYQLSPILASSGEDFQGLMDRANELGLVMSGDSVAAGVVLGDTMSDVKQAFSAVVAEVGVEVMPIIQQLLDWVIEHMPEIKEFISNAMTVAQAVFQKVGEIIAWLSEKFDVYWPIISDAVSKAVEKVKTIWENNLKPIIIAVWEAVKSMAATIKQIWEQNIKPIVDAAWGFIKQMWEGSLKPIFTGIVTFFKGIFSGDIKQAMSGLKTYIKGIWDGIVMVIKTPVNTIIGVINGFIRGITGGINTVIRALNGLKIDVPKWVQDLTGVKSFGFNIPEVSAPQIPLLAKGGDVTQEGAAIVGEAGAELLQLPKGARVTPLEKAGDTTVNISIDVHPSEGMDEERLARAVADRINNEVQRQVTAWA